MVAIGAERTLLDFGVSYIGRDRPNSDMQQTARLLSSMPFQSSTTDYQVSPSTYVRTAQGDGIQLAPADFAMSYITRSRRIDIVRLRKVSPRFVERYERQSC